MSEDGALDDEGIERLSQVFTLNILNENDDTIIPLRIHGALTILEIKTNVYTITNIAVRHQDWVGWPEGTTNDSLLALTGIPLEHSLTLKTTAVVPEPCILPAINANEVIEIDSDGSVDDEFEDASEFNTEEDLFAAETVNRRLKHLSEFIFDIFHKHSTKILSITT